MRKQIIEVIEKLHCRRRMHIEKKVLKLLLAEVNSLPMEPLCPK